MEPLNMTENMQDVFLNYCRKDKKPVTVYLVNGVKLQGTITGFDNFSVVLKRNQHSQLVYKHSIATVVPSSALRLDGDDEDESSYIDDSESFEMA